jgi:hypothetical protein
VLVSFTSRMAHPAGFSPVKMESSASSLTLTKQSWKKRRTRPGPLPGSRRMAARTMLRMRSSARGQVRL